MNMEQLRAIAVERGLKPGKLKKSDLIRLIQQAEGNESCFDTGKVAVCGQDECLWRGDCR